MTGRGRPRGFGRRRGPGTVHGKDDGPVEKEVRDGGMKGPQTRYRTVVPPGGWGGHNLPRAGKGLETEGRPGARQVTSCVTSATVLHDPPVSDPETPKRHQSHIGRFKSITSERGSHDRTPPPRDPSTSGTLTLIAGILSLGSLKETRKTACTYVGLPR